MVLCDKSVYIEIITVLPRNEKIIIYIPQKKRLKPQNKKILQTDEATRKLIMNNKNKT